MADSLPQPPASLKSTQHYLKTALEHDRRDPVISYYCRLYVFQRSLDIDSKSPEAKAYLTKLIDFLEKTKKARSEEEAIHNEVVGQAHVENYAIKMFLYADNEDRAARFNKNVVKTFYTAGLLMDVLSYFGDVGEEIEKNKKYAKWKAAYINKCIKNGETPIAGPLPDDDEEGAAGGAPATIGFEQPGPSTGYPATMPMPPANDPSPGLYPTPGAHAPPTTPQDPVHQQGYQPAPHRSPQPAPRSLPQAQPVSSGQDWTPPPNPSGVKLSAEQYQKGIKLCKYASSAMQYEDSATAIANLTKALKLLTTGSES